MTPAAQLFSFRKNAEGEKHRNNDGDTGKWGGGGRTEVKAMGWGRVEHKVFARAFPGPPGTASSETAICPTAVGIHWPQCACPVEPGFRGSLDGKRHVSLVSTCESSGPAWRRLLVPVACQHGVRKVPCVGGGGPVESMHAHSASRPTQDHRGPSTGLLQTRLFHHSHFVLALLGFLGCPCPCLQAESLPSTGSSRKALASLLLVALATLCLLSDPPVSRLTSALACASTEGPVGS